MEARSLDAFRQQAREFTLSLGPGSAARLVTLTGELGAGKTTFVQEVARTLGVEETVSSPTFVIEKRYELRGQTFAHLIHIDAYRLKSEEELLKLGWHELLADSGKLIFLEWPERVPRLIPEAAVRVQIDITREGRIITVDGKESGEEKNKDR